MEYLFGYLLIGVIVVVMVINPRENDIIDYLENIEKLDTSDLNMDLKTVVTLFKILAVFIWPTILISLLKPPMK